MAVSFFIGWWKWFGSCVLKYGPIPKHVAIIMDGNRRWATKLNLQKADGHSFGFQKLQEVFEWCLDFNIQILTVYAFSTENFKRPKAEVDALMELARVKFRDMLENGNLMQRKQVRVQVIGNVSLLPEDIQRILAKTVHETRNNNRYVQREREM